MINNGKGNIKAINVISKNMGSYQISYLLKTINQIVSIDSLGNITGLNPEFKKIIITEIKEEIITDIIKCLCECGIIDSPYCNYPYVQECCGNNLIKNIDNNIFKTLNNDLLYSDDNFSMLSTEIIEDLNTIENLNIIEESNKIDIENKLLNKQLDEQNDEKIDKHIDNLSNSDLNLDLNLESDLDL